MLSKTIRKLYALLACSAVLVISGCGYQLRGADPGVAAQFSRIFVQPSVSAALESELKRQLHESGVTVTKSAAKADAVLILSNEQFDRRVLSVDGDTGKVLEYELGYEVKLKATRADGSVLLEPRNITVLRDITFDRNAVLGKFEEEQTVRREMTEDVAQAILFGLQTIENPVTPQKPTAPKQ